MIEKHGDSTKFVSIPLERWIALQNNLKEMASAADYGQAIHDDHHFDREGRRKAFADAWADSVGKFGQVIGTYGPRTPNLMVVELTEDMDFPAIVEAREMMAGDPTYGDLADYFSRRKVSALVMSCVKSVRSTWLVDTSIVTHVCSFERDYWLHPVDEPYPIIDGDIATGSDVDAVREWFNCCPSDRNGMYMNAGFIDSVLDDSRKKLVDIANLNPVDFNLMDGRDGEEKYEKYIEAVIEHLYANGTGF